MALIAGLFAVVCLKPLDHTPYQQTDFYRKEMSLVDSLFRTDFPQEQDSVLHVGWSRINLLPDFTTPIAIDAKRGGKHFDGVHDSIYIRAFVFKQGDKKVALVSADLLIIPPSVTRYFDTILSKEGFDTRNIFFTATHTHTSLGGWYPSVVGEIFAGKFDERVPMHIAATVAKAIVEASSKTSAAKIGYANFPCSKLVFNRLLKQMAHLPESLGKVDSMLRVVKIEKANGQQAAILTFSAHNTVYHENLMQLSGDWSGKLMAKLGAEEDIHFNSFSAGAVGSHGPFEFSKNQEQEAEYMADGIATIVRDNFKHISTRNISSMRMVHLPLYLREPNLRVTDNLVVRPWLFNKLFGKEKSFVNFFQLGNILFVGMPCDYSGELTAEIDSVAQLKNRQVIVTSFNGGYIGYITDARWYHLNTYETRTMGWFGEHNGDYLNEIVMRVLSFKTN